jgi:HMG (high mobility group) box
MRTPTFGGSVDNVTPHVLPVAPAEQETKEVPPKKGDMPDDPADKTARGESKKVAKIPRPPNAFILYRRSHHPIVKQAHPEMHNNDICTNHLLFPLRSETNTDDISNHAGKAVEIRVRTRQGSFQSPGRRNKREACQRLPGLSICPSEAPRKEAPCSSPSNPDACISHQRPAPELGFQPSFSRTGYGHPCRCLHRCCASAGSERRADPVHHRPTDRRPGLRWHAPSESGEPSWHSSSHIMSCTLVSFEGSTRGTGNRVRDCFYSWPVFAKAYQVVVLLRSWEAKSLHCLGVVVYRVFFVVGTNLAYLGVSAA